MRRTLLVATVIALSTAVSTPAQDLFKARGYLVEDSSNGTILLYWWSDGHYFLDNYGEFVIGDYVWVEGTLNPICDSVPIYPNISGCIEDNSIDSGCFASLDIDGDGIIDMGDLLKFWDFLFVSYNGLVYRSDLNEDCVLDSSDYEIFFFCAFNDPWYCWWQWPVPTCCEVTRRCCYGMRGDISGRDGIADMSDLTALIDYLFICQGCSLSCEEEADVNADLTIDIGDLTSLIDYLFISFAPPEPCP